MSDKNTKAVEKAKEFLDEVRAVCRKHGMQLCASGYDGLQVWELDEDESELHFNGIDICMNGMRVYIEEAEGG